MTDESKPTRGWEHSHALNEGDELRFNHGRVMSVVAVRENGTVVNDDGELFSEMVITNWLARGDIERVSDGKSHELATF